MLATRSLRLVFIGGQSVLIDTSLDKTGLKNIMDQCILSPVPDFVVFPTISPAGEEDEMYVKFNQILCASIISKSSVSVVH